MGSTRRYGGAFRLAICCLPWLAALAALMYATWWQTDDAYISYRYARNLLEGHGLVFNVGERVEGYTNFLWVLELAAIWAISGLPPEYTAHWLSLVCTAALLAVLCWQVLRLPGLEHRSLTVWLMLGLLCTSATFAVWSTAGGLETRQFTLLVALGGALFALCRRSRWGLAAGSAALGLAALTRPEGMMFGGLVVGWWCWQQAVGRGVAGWNWRLWVGMRPRWREFGLAVGPFVVLVAGHLAFRLWYYGEWLPNTYYAKNLGPWWDAGGMYLAAAMLACGGYLWLPLAGWGAWRRWRLAADGSGLLVLGMVLCHGLYLARIGGDHFEWRPFDVWWALLAPYAGMGLAGVCLWAYRGRRWRTAVARRLAAGALAAAVLIYCGLLQGAALAAAADRDEDEPICLPAVELPENLELWVKGMPGMSWISDTYIRLSPWLARRLVGMNTQCVDDFTHIVLSRFRSLHGVYYDALPGDAVIAQRAMGVGPYYLDRVPFVDVLGLTDKAAARNPIDEDRVRLSAHSRFPPPGYLAERGVNLMVLGVADTLGDAVDEGFCAAPLSDGRWMKLIARPEWIERSFDGMARCWEPWEWVFGREPDAQAGGWEVWLVGDRLLFRNDSCWHYDAYYSGFFLRMEPLHQQDRWFGDEEWGYDVKPWHFWDGGRYAGDYCLMVGPELPYPARWLRVVKLDRYGHIDWQVEFHTGE